MPPSSNPGSSEAAPRLRIAYFGLPLGAILLARHGFAPVAACIGHPDAPGMRRLRRDRGIGRGLLLGQPRLDDPDVARALRSTEYDVILSWFWPRRIPPSLLDAAPRGAFGCHPSLLPRYRGPDPYFHVIAQGEERTGVTLHRLEAEYDTGRVIAAITLPIAADEDAWRLARRLDRPSLALLVGAARALEQGLALEGEAQDESLASQAPRPLDEDLCLRVQDDAQKAARLVRASAPLGASVELGDTLVQVLRARAVGLTPLLETLEAGEACLLGDEVVVRCGQGGLVLERVRVCGAPDDDEPEETVLCGLDIARLLSL